MTRKRVVWKWRFNKGAIEKFLNSLYGFDFIFGASMASIVAGIADIPLLLIGTHNNHVVWSWWRTVVFILIQIPAGILSAMLVAVVVVAIVMIPLTGIMWLRDHPPLRFESYPEDHQDLQPQDRYELENL